MKMNTAGVTLIHSFESCKLKAYRCPGGKWTIGWGNTRYEDGSPVQEGDHIFQNRADELFATVLLMFIKGVKQLLTAKLNDNQFSALVSFAYNCGATNLKNSTLLKKVNAYPADPAIRREFERWVHANGQMLSGLMRRRKAEADLYFA